MKAAQAVQLTSLLKRKIAARAAAKIPVGSAAWKTFEVQWDHLNATTVQRHKTEMAELLQRQKARQDGILPQWKAGSVPQRESLLRAHLMLFEALVALPEKSRSKLMPELNLDLLDSDESLLRGFHRRHDAIKKVADSLRLESKPIP